MPEIMASFFAPYFFSESFSLLLHIIIACFIYPSAVHFCLQMFCCARVIEENVVKFLSFPDIKILFFSSVSELHRGATATTRNVCKRRKLLFSIYDDAVA